MSETNNDTLDQATIDPPDNNGGTGTNAVLSPSSGDASAVDPPDNNGGTGGKTGSTTTINQVN